MFVRDYVYSVRIQIENDYFGLEIGSENISDIGFLLFIKAKIETSTSRPSRFLRVCMWVCVCVYLKLNF